MWNTLNDRTPNISSFTSVRTLTESEVILRKNEISKTISFVKNFTILSS